MNISVSWKSIILTAAALLIAQTLVGFFEGAFVTSHQESGFRQFLLSSAISFLLATAIFWFMVSRQHQRPILHASMALLIAAIASSALAALMIVLLGTRFHPVLVGAEWLVLLLALAAGTSLGRLTGGRSRDHAADA